MNRPFITLILAVFVLSWGFPATAANDLTVEVPVITPFTLTSPAFHNGGHIPEEYSCKGADTNPILWIYNTPKGTRSLVLTVREPDNPITNWTHWLVYNIDPGVREIKQGAVPGTQALNDFGNFYYGGPCTFDAKKHHFVFTMYALNDTLDDVNEGATMDIVEKSMRGKIIDKAVLVGIYQNPLWGQEDAPL
jgi:Raf kinase inhibitor-like YbhB/YbcL family protein